MAEAVEQEANHHIANQILQSTSLSDLRGEDAAEDSSSALRSGLRSSLENLGFRLDNVWVGWNETEAEKLVGMRNDLENLVERNAILTETEFEQIETICEALPNLTHWTPIEPRLGSESGRAPVIDAIAATPITKRLSMIVMTASYQDIAALSSAERKKLDRGEGAPASRLITRKV